MEDRRVVVHLKKNPAPAAGYQELFDISACRGESVDKQIVRQMFIKHFLRKPGEHLFMIGITGAGKTQKLYYYAHRLIDQGETIVWIDTGKDYSFGDLWEIGPLFSLRNRQGQIHPVNLISPTGTEITCQGAPGPVTMKKADRPADVWGLIQPRAINILCLSRFFLDKGTTAKYWSQVFKTLALSSNIKPLKKQIRPALPLAIIGDELWQLAMGQSMGGKKGSFDNAGELISQNINQIRSMGIRMIGSTQGWTMVLPNVRQAFSWILCCRGTEFRPGEGSRILRKFNPQYMGLKVNQAIMWFPDRRYHNVWTYPLYETDSNLRLDFDGILENI